jgi:osmotically inducible protein OsmC
MIRSATAIWRGGPGAGEGSVSTSSGVITNAIYSFSSGSGNEPCTSPGEMLAAAEASCMSLIVAQELARAGFKAESIATRAEINVKEVDALWTITDIHLDVSVQVKDMDPEHFKAVAEAAKRRCPITRTLKANITMDAKFVPSEVHTVV